MKLVIEKNRSITSVGTWGTENENNYEVLHFEFPQELQNYNKRIVYYLGDEKVWDAIVDDKAYITNAITKYEKVKAYVWCTKTDDDIEKDIDFRTKLFEMNFYENENADGIVPTEEQVDGFNTMLTAMNNKIQEINDIEETIETNETERQAAEAERERRTDEAIDNIVDMTEAYNQNATQKTNDFNDNATQKTNDFNENAINKRNQFNENAVDKTNDFNLNAEDKTDDFNANAVSKTNDFNDNADDRVDELNDIAEAIEDMTTAIQFATFEVDDDMHLNIIQAEKLKNTNFIFNPETGRLGVRIYNG